MRLCSEKEAQQTSSMCSAMSNWAALSLAGQNEEKNVNKYIPGDTCRVWNRAEFIDCLTLNVY